AENGSPQAWDGSDDGEQSEEIGHDRTVVSATHGLNMRDEQNGNVIHVLPRGAECDVLERDGEWCRVSYKAEGWVRSEFLA
ncbi:SH3 domain-containing protein, partial [Eggerthella sp. BIOML-A4]